MNFDFFDNLKEYVYVADTKTYNLIYINPHLRSVLNPESTHNYQCKKCYQVLYNKDQPCSFCTNSILKSGKIHEWTFTNPIFNKPYLLRDTLVFVDQKPCHFQICSELSASSVNRLPLHDDAKQELFLTECLNSIHSISDPVEALEHLLSFIGKNVPCERSFIFEKQKNKSYKNTYEWAITPEHCQQELRQNEDHTLFLHWLDSLEKNRPVIVFNSDSLRETCLASYVFLTFRNLSSIILVPLISDNELIGFAGMDNIPEGAAQYALQLLRLASYFFVSFLKRRNLLEHLSHLSYHDQLTDALNRNAFAKMVDAPPSFQSLGVIFCDIIGLKKTNDSLGYSGGDRLVIHFYRLIAEFFPAETIYRTGGDEFVILCPDCSLNDFFDSFYFLKQTIEADENKMALGYSWQQGESVDVSAQVTAAMEYMYHDKNNRYGTTLNAFENSCSLVRHRPETSDFSAQFSKYLKSNYFDTEFLIKSVSNDKNSCYVYFGDLQTNLFFVSDNMRDDFGFQSNLVYNLLERWEKRIFNEVDLQLYRNELQSLLQEHRTVHNLRYQVKDREGNVFWIHCRGLMKWSNDVPVFFSGCVTRQESDFIVDSITNFPREFAALNKLTELSSEKVNYPVIAFSLNHFTEINESHGRNCADLLLRETAFHLSEVFQNNILFYRLDGLRFMGIVDPDCSQPISEVIQTLKSIVEEEYYFQNILVKHPCSVGLLHFPLDGNTPEDFLVNLTSLISLSKVTHNQDYVVHSAQNIERQKEQAQLALALNKSILNDFAGFRIVVQPIVDAQTGQICGGESLLRWTSDNRPISPAVFVPILEKNRLIVPVGKWIFEQVVRICKQIVTHNPEFYLSFNVSYFQILEEDFLDFMRDTLEKYKLDGKHLLMELTETHFDEAPEKLAVFIQSCHELGMRVALDDFGSGYSSLGLLLKYSTDVIKLDRSLLHEMSKDINNAKFIKSIVYACHQFNQKVCMEGVETEEEVEMIRATGCNMIQGYYFYKPLELADLYSLVVEKIKPNL